MRCQICNEPALPGARLCAACKKALKRARHDTQSVMQPLLECATRTLERRRLQHAAKRDARRPTSIIPPVLTTPRDHSPLLYIGLALPLCAVAYFAAQRLGATPGVDTASPPQARPAVSAEASVAVPVAPQPVAEVTPTAPPVVETKPAPRPVRAGLAPARPPASAMVAVAGPVELTAPLAAEAAPREATPAIPAVREAPPLDRGQVLAGLFERCPGNVIEKAVCEQRVRLQHCEGYWGQVPQCPASRDSYGQ